MLLIEVIILLLLAIVILIAIFGKYLTTPYPILLVIGGLVLGLVPVLPKLELDPHFVFLCFLPPLLYSAALFTSWREFKADIHHISSLAFGLVFATTFGVAFIAHYTIPELTWTAALVLGAIVSPPDAVAATSITQRLNVHPRLVAILEGESLINDASGLIAYRFAVAAVVTGTFSFWSASLQFITVSVGGILLGLGMGWILANIQKRLNDPPVQITLSLLTPFIVYLGAEELHLSGVLATVATGMYIGRHSSEFLSPVTRLQLVAVWQTVIFVLNGFVFIIIGLQLPFILENILKEKSLSTLLWQASLISIAVIAIRLLWVFPSAYFPQLLGHFIPCLRKDTPPPPWEAVLMVGWSGMRGIVSLGAALAIPLYTIDNQLFPARDLIIFLTFCVIFSTLVLQGLTLPALIRWLGVTDDGEATKEEMHARIKGLQAGIARIDELVAMEMTHVPYEKIAYVRHWYEDRINRYTAHLEGNHNEKQSQIDKAVATLQQEALKSTRRTIIELRNQDKLSDEGLRKIQHQLDLVESHIHHDIVALEHSLQLKES
ncbi:Na+/H+ antiporter [Beggiatoa leptomitoformis]|uniref:Na+/H+ antiporter n=1 Tax=Beggiatoa leptomitoformis TaxID=288004 RepID=A0A2N9YFV8_9GAMM|nr:Na+/H+ antiporter [Beggiatoa leptomitoformis]ALG68321.1 Na+/H+ antiporter [Beggiatoa leptomitoformis]AUI69363.1 Na+/H+ antiporter [Beggiatoa leptomitoformis]